MRARLADQRGFSLVELMIVSSLFLIVLGATLTVAGSFERFNQEAQNRDNHVDRARRGMERGMRQLRNLARRIDAPVINRATAGDFIFQTSDPERTWMRYCLERQSGGKVWLWSLSSASSVTGAMSGPCPGTGWSLRDVVAEDVANTSPGRDFPLFKYGCVQTAPVACPSTTADLGRITSVTMDLWIDDDLTRKPPASRMTSAVFLRNQNEAPTASFTSRPVATRQVILNASASLDPEGRTMRFMWFRAPAPAFTCDEVPPATQLLWQGVTMTHTFLPAEGASGTQRPMELVVCDPGNLQARATAMVTIP
jgi:prepilin-type N-terminal cleavage/methylation domain-containing protein